MKKPRRAAHVASPTTWPHAVEDFVKALGKEERSQHTTHHYSDDLRHFELWWNEANPTEPLLPVNITDEDLRDWKEALRSEPIDGAGGRRKPATVNAKMSAMKSFLAWCHRKEVIAILPAMPRMENLGPRAVKWLTDKEQRQLIRQAGRHRSPRVLPMVRVFMETGLRLAELVALRRKDVVISERKGQAQVHEGKGRKPRTIPLSQEAREAFQKLLDLNPGGGPMDPVFTSQRKDKVTGRGKALTGRGVQEVLDRLKGELGWEELHPHLLRHTFGMNLRRKGTDWPVIAKLMGHTSVVTTMQHYGTPSERDLRAAVDPDGDE